MRFPLVSIVVAALAATFGSFASAAVLSTVSVPAGADTAVIGTVGTPEGFEQLTRPHEILVDVFFGGSKVGEARAIVRPGFLRFVDPARVAAEIPDLENVAAIVPQLSGELTTNADRVCAVGRSGNCGHLSPDAAGIIFDEEHFRVDLFVAPRLLKTRSSGTETYLAAPRSPLSLTSSVALALSGSSNNSTLYNFQNRTIIGLRNARIRNDSSLASGLGLLVDDLFGEVDRNGSRISGGLFWAPGIDLIGRRRILGVGIATQFDTRADRENLTGTPIILFLSQSSRVDLLVDGRLITSRGYDAGNNLIDTTALPEGSYLLVLRIHEVGGSIREERRFFVKNAQIAPIGRPIYFAYAGMLANTRRKSFISVSRDAFYQLGAARRLSQSAAVDVSLIGTQNKTIGEVGAWLITTPARVRAAGLVSTAGDHAALLQVQSTDLFGFGVGFDARKVWSKNGRPLLPIQTYVAGFDAIPVTTAQLGGSFLQASGTIGRSFGAAYLSVIGSLRKDDGKKADYSIGPDVRWSVVNRGALRILVQASVQRTRTTTASYIGFQLYSSVGRISLSGSGGFDRRSEAASGGEHSDRAVGSMSAQYTVDGNDRTQLSIGAGVDRSIDSTIAHGEGTAYTRFGSARGDVWHSLEGVRATQYGLTLQTGIAVGSRQLAFGGRDIAESALVVALDGSATTQFDVLVNNQSRGHIGAGSRLPLFVQPYHAYDIRLKPLAASGVNFDNASRKVTVFPGNVQLLRWTAVRTATVFAQAVTAGGAPVPDAMVQSSQGVGQTDASGYFQIEARDGDVLRFSGSEGPICQVPLRKVAASNDFVSLGKVDCR